MTDETHDVESPEGDGEPESWAGKSAEPEALDSLRVFGEVIKAFRRRAELTQEQFASVVGYSVPTVGSIEQGRRFPSLAFVARSEDVLDGFGAIEGAAKKLARRPGLADWFRQWALLEEQAITLYTYENRLIPGLLQAESFARVLFENQLPSSHDTVIEARLAERMERQRLLRDRPDTIFSFILEEHVLLRGTGGPEVTRASIDRLLEVAELRNVELQIMPLRQGHHAGLDGPMRLLETPENRWFAYCEGQRGGQFISEAKEISVLQTRHARMRSQALSFEDSLGLLQRMRGAL
ncbi:helix-turn-helix transcriptional regulator [Streptomyces sp. NPDC006798]|uniref:helix-turn-helix domain-containing protein n=1 Tax=Streptomyces sp. NPDC006798 TaxID=3155462 RepID=UPI00340CA710